MERNEVDLFPLLVPLEFSASGVATRYRGFLNILGNEYEVEFILPSSGKICDANIRSSPALSKIISGSEHLIKQRLKQCSNLKQFLLELRDILERVARAKKTAAALPPAHFYARCVHELDQLGWDRIVNLDRSLTALTVKIIDGANREHLVNIRLPPNYPALLPQCAADLPEAVHLSWNAKTSSLLDVYNQYEKALEQYQAIWMVLDDFDTNTHVLEPERASRAFLRRRIALGHHASVQLVFVAAAASAAPEVRFLGAESVVGPLRERLNKLLHTWNERELPRLNLQRILEVQFPSPAHTRREDFTVECAVCYAYRWDDQSIPDKICENQKCGRAYHTHCLYSWLKTIPTSRQSLNMMFGSCPYCNTSITVKMP